MAAPQGDKEPIAIISQSSNIEVDGSYQYRWDFIVIIFLA